MILNGRIKPKMDVASLAILCTTKESEKNSQPTTKPNNNNKYEPIVEIVKWICDRRIFYYDLFFQHLVDLFNTILRLSQ